MKLTPRSTAAATMSAAAASSAWAPKVMVPRQTRETVRSVPDSVRRSMVGSLFVAGSRRFAEAFWRTDASAKRREPGVLIREVLPQVRYAFARPRLLPGD